MAYTPQTEPMSASTDAPWQVILPLAALVALFLFLGKSMSPSEGLDCRQSIVDEMEPTKFADFDSLPEYQWTIEERYLEEC